MAVAVTDLELWAATRVGAPFKAKGRGPDAYDCGGLVLAAYRDVFRLELPDFTWLYESIKDRDGVVATLRQALGEHGQEIKPGHERPGDTVLLRVYGLPFHVGLVIALGRFLHSIEGMGVCVEDYRSVTWQRRVLGFYRPLGLGVPA